MYTDGMEKIRKRMHLPKIFRRKTSRAKEKPIEVHLDIPVVLDEQGTVIGLDLGECKLPSDRKSK